MLEIFVPQFEIFCIPIILPQSGSKSGFGLVYQVLIIIIFVLSFYSLLTAWVPQGRVDHFSSFFGYFVSD